MTHRRPMAQTVMAWFISVAVVLISISIVFLTATFWWPYEPLTKLEITVTNTPSPGGRLIARVDYCKPEEASPVEVRWTLINDITILLDDGTASLPSGCHVTSRVFVVSPIAPPGMYRLQVESLYAPWPWRRVDVVRRSPAFLITP